jgi:putative effector of murein hydrolase
MTGITGAVSAPAVLSALRINHRAACGFSMGLASHGIDTACAFQEGGTAGAFSGLAMALNAVAVIQAPRAAAGALMRFSGMLQKCPCCDA